jgi:DNA-binding IclR family transcriptional regulator
MPSIDKIHSIFELLRTHYKSGLSNKEISQALNIPPSTCYRILASLKKYDYVYQRKKDARYFLGFAHLRLAESVVEGMDLAAICLPYLEELHSQTEETTFFALYNGSHCIAMEICGQINTRVSVGRGEIMPLHCAASGKAVLAFLPEKDREAILRGGEREVYTPETITDAGTLRKDLATIWQTGVAYNHQEFHRGITALAVPLFGNDNRVIGAIALVGTSVDLDAQQLDEYAPMFVDAAAAISGRIGATYPQHILDHWAEKSARQTNGGQGKPAPR